MPYDNLSELPDQVKNSLPKHAQEIYIAAYNNAWDQYKDPADRKGNDTREETSHKIAWAAVKNQYEKRNDGWQKKN